MLVLLPEAYVVVALGPDVATESMTLVIQLLTLVNVLILANAADYTIASTRLPIELAADSRAIRVRHLSIL